MKHDRIFVRSLIILVMSMICLVNSTVIAGQARPFQGRIEGQFVGTPTNNPIIYNSVANANGNAAHVGRFTKVTSDIFNIATGEVVGTFTITAANGDLLSGQYSGYVIPETATTFSWILNATFTGGTGRFANATGEFVFEAQGQYFFASGNLYGTYVETFDGTISY
jgi:hypothetical protein